MLKLITDDSLARDWNAVAAHPMQSWEWGHVRTIAGSRVLKIARMDEAGVICEVFLCTVHALPGGRTLVNIARSRMPDADVLLFIKREVPSCMCVKLEPALYIEEAGKYKLPLLSRTWQDRGLTYTLSNSRVFAQHSFTVDLSPSEEILLSRMKSKTRYNIRLATKKGVTVKDETDSKDGFEVFFKLYKKTIKRQNYLGHNHSYHKIVWEALAAADMARIFTAYYNNLPLASYQIFFFKHKAYYVYGGTSTQHKEVMASNLLMWECLRAAKHMKCTEFDMWGALAKTYDPKDPWAGFHRFKEGYAGKHVSYLPTIDVVFDTAYYRLFSFLWPVRTKVLEFLSKLRISGQ